MKSLILRYILCCHDTEEEPKPRQAAHHLHNQSSDSVSLKEVSVFAPLEASGEKLEERRVDGTADTPGTVGDSTIGHSIGEEKPVETETKEETSGNRKAKRKKRASKDKTKQEPAPPLVISAEGKHEPLPRDAKPKKSILKKR